MTTVPADPPLVAQQLGGAVAELLSWLHDVAPRSDRGNEVVELVAAHLGARTVEDHEPGAGRALVDGADVLGLADLLSQATRRVGRSSDRFRRASHSSER